MNLYHLVLQYWWTLPSAAYTVGSFVWSVRIERACRQLKREQAVHRLQHTDLRADLDDVQNFLENGNTLREINVIPITRKVHP